MEDFESEQNCTNRSKFRYTAINMDFFQIHFPVSGIECPVFIPPLVAFIISLFTSMAGISGAFLILPFQISILGFAGPAVSSTNFLYNVVGTPGGVLRYVREKRMVWLLAGCIICGTFPGVLIGYYFRVRFLPAPRTFKLFVGLVLLYIGSRLLKDIWRQTLSKKTGHQSLHTENISFNHKTIGFTLLKDDIYLSVPAIFFPSLAVGIISGIYGIGGGAIIAPFCVAIMRIPVYAVAGAVLMANFMTSAAGVLFYSTISFSNGHIATPDWLLGLLFGIGGLLGMYSGAKWQRYMPERTIKSILVLIIFAVAAKYIIQYLYPK